MNNEQCMTQPILINLHPNEYNERLCYYPFAVNLDRCMGSCNALHDLSNKVYDNRNESQILNIIYHVNVNVNLMVENVT